MFIDYVAAHWLRRSSIRDAPSRRINARTKERAMTSIKTITEKLNAWRRYREAVRELSRLNDRELSDIGIRRGDIEFIVRQSVAAA
jgi:uncharacterized protein YjiS (DUF1127 family)